MAITRNILFSGASGKVGNLVFRRSPHGTVVAIRPKKRDKSKPISEAQQGVRHKFTRAAAYAREQMNDPDIRTMYESAVSDKRPSVYNVAMSDFLKAPKINSIFTGDYHGRPGEPVVIHACDDFQVVRVTVAVRDRAGKVIEEGEAMESDVRKDRWIFHSTVVNSSPAGSVISACAEDLAGNCTRESVNL
jgi:hypothetical protein